MLKHLKKIFMPIFLSIICGFVCGRLMFDIYDNKGKDILESNVIYLLEEPSVDSVEAMQVSNLTSYIYYEDEGKYNRVVALTKDKDNIDKIEKVYNKKLNVNKYLLSDKDMTNKIEEYDKLLKNEDKSEEIKNIIIEMINLYKDNDSIKMVKIS